MKTLFLAVLALSQSLPAAAQPETPAGPKISVEIKALREVREKKGGKEIVRLEPVDKARSGETLIYAVSYRNEGSAPAKGAVITDPLPKGAVCLPATALTADAETEFSADGGGTWGRYPLRRAARPADGRKTGTPVADAEITHVRWTLKKDLPPGASGEIRFKVKVK